MTLALVLRKSLDPSLVRTEDTVVLDRTSSRNWKHQPGEQKQLSWKRYY